MTRYDLSAGQWIIVFVFISAVVSVKYWIFIPLPHIVYRP